MSQKDCDDHQVDDSCEEQSKNKLELSLSCSQLFLCCQVRLQLGLTKIKWRQYFSGADVYILKLPFEAIHPPHEKDS